MYLFRIHIRPSGGSASMRDTFAYCIKNGVLGVGWRTNSGRNTKDWDEYFKEASTIHDNLNVCAYIHKWVGEGDLIWTRDLDGQYYLARVKSGWEYWTSEEAIKLDIDIANIIKCDFQKIEIDRVPGKVKACFRGGRTFQEIADKTVLEYSKSLWNNLSGTAAYAIDRSTYPDIFTMLDDEETEDLIFLYLQSKGWYVVPNSRKADTMSFEYLVVNPETAQYAQVQVKTGNTPLDLGEYAEYPFKVFLFQANGLYNNGPEANNTTCISRKEIEEFLASAGRWLPKLYTEKMQLLVS